ncbi:MAG: HAD hydrolase-like protein, partial [Clostridiales bacterium]|nr:HAD hydrolase-like protein [Clostridiales bacterium]
MKYAAVVFDLDGTLTDSQPGIMRSAAYALEKMGKSPLSDAALRKFLGPPLTQSFAEHAGMSAEETIQATHLYRERYANIGWRENKVYPGIRRLLQALKNQGAYLAVATGKLMEASVDILTYFDLARYFDDVQGPRAHEYH